MYNVVVANDEKKILEHLEIRKQVFIFEQKINYIDEFDDLDSISTLLLALDDDKPIGTARIIFEDGRAKIGRLAVIKEYRNKNVGSKIICEAEKYIKNNTACIEVIIDAQLHAVPFYEKNGYHKNGSIFTEANIQHIRMNKFLI